MSCPAQGLAGRSGGRALGKAGESLYNVSLVHHGGQRSQARRGMFASEHIPASSCYRPPCCSGCFFYF
ncbi:hypothetical protein CBF45_05805 [Bordetella sp. J329]|nr:hypothetical protein CBF45_05805 [Bordetella sp. J329]